MAAFLVTALVMLARRDAFFMKNGFYLMVLWYAAQRFCWEFLKPYAPALGPLNLFHLICLGLMGYALVMLRSNVASVRGCPEPRDASLEPRGG
jgi:phosphatidylglycerol:prolipoprotein diacylglycerol transferase